MLEDRPYMRGDSEDGFGRRITPGVLLLIINTVVFALQCIERVYFRSGFEHLFYLSSEGLRHGYVWQVFTFQFLHKDFSHLFFNALGLYMFGRTVESTLGAGRFWEVYFVSGTLGGILQVVLGLIIPGVFGFPTVGASAGVLGLLAMFCLLYRDQTVLLMFVLPVRAYHLLIGSLAVAGFFVLVPADASGVAHAAHLGGMLGAIGYHRWFLSRERRLFNWRPYGDVLKSRRDDTPSRKILFPKFTSEAPKSSKSRDAGENSKEALLKEVNAILDKMHAHGSDSLTQAERDTLKAASARLKGN